ncbi:response regulator [Thiovibrio sp. JS02]
MHTPKVLYVDDEAINGSNFLQTFQGEYTVLLAASGAEALELIADHDDIAVILSDQRMPGLSGAEVLVRAMELRPHAERIMVTAYSEPDDIISAINQGQVYRYIVKPWAEEELRITMLQAVERFRLKQENRGLLEELQLKNRQLAEWNAVLEQRVAARTEELAQLNEHLLSRVEELEKARDEVSALKKLLPICSYCKKIRDDQDYWHNLESYLHHNTDMMFTHGICPTCYDTVLSQEMGKGGKKSGK